MRYQILLIAIMFSGCEKPESNANSIVASEESYADRFLKDLEINLVAEGASEQESAKIRDGAKSKIDSLTLVNVDTNDSDRVSALGLQGALQTIDGIAEKENQVKLAKIILPVISSIRLTDSKKETAIESLNEMLRFFTEYNPDSEIVGLSAFKLKNILLDYGVEAPESELIHSVLTGLKNASVDLSSDPDSYFVEKFSTFSESYLGETVASAASVESGMLNKMTQPFMKALPNVFDFTQETMDYSTLISKLGVATKKAVAKGPDGISHEMSAFEKDLLATGKEALSKIYGDSTEATEIEGQFQKQFEESLAGTSTSSASPVTQGSDSESCTGMECSVTP